MFEEIGLIYVCGVFVCIRVDGVFLVEVDVVSIIFFGLVFF